MCKSSSSTKGTCWEKLKSSIFRKTCGWQNSQIYQKSKLEVATRIEKEDVAEKGKKSLRLKFYD